MLNLSIMPLDVDHLDEVSSDIIEQQRTGVSTHAMFMMKFNPEGTPAVDKATKQCEKYDLFRERLDKAGAKHGVLVQATLGHITVPSSPYPFQPSVFLSTGEDRVVTCCPLDPDFRKYIKEQFRILAEHHPSVVMLDDDLGLFYKQTKGCACKYPSTIPRTQSFTSVREGLMTADSSPPPSTSPRTFLRTCRS